MAFLLKGRFASSLSSLLQTFRNSVAATYSVGNIPNNNLTFTCDLFPQPLLDKKTHIFGAFLCNDDVLLG